MTHPLIRRALATDNGAAALVLRIPVGPVRRRRCRSPVRGG